MMKEKKPETLVIKSEDPNSIHNNWNSMNTDVYCFTKKDRMHCKPPYFNVRVNFGGIVVDTPHQFANYKGRPVQVLIQDKKKKYDHHKID